MDDTIRFLVDDVVTQLAEVQATRSQWEPDFDVYSFDLAGKVSDIVDATPSDSAAIRALIRDPGNSFRAIADTLVASACWLCINGSAETRKMLYETFASWGGIITLLANISGRLFARFEKTGDIRYALLSLAAIALLADNADPREDSRFIGRVRVAVAERGHDPVPIFQEFTKISIGRAKALFEAVLDDTL